MSVFLQTPILNIFELKSVKKTNIVKKWIIFRFFYRFLTRKYSKSGFVKKTDLVKKSNKNAFFLQADCIFEKKNASKKKMRRKRIFFSGSLVFALVSFLFIPFPLRVEFALALQHTAHLYAIQFFRRVS